MYEPKPFWKGWYSHKFKAAGLRYEVAVSIQNGDIVWINGPFPCGKWPDIKIFREDLIHELEPGEKVEADRGYQGEPRCITPQEGNDRAKTVRARHETANKRLKQWGCLKELFRHDIRLHSTAFRAVAVITQIAIEHGEPLFVVEYNNNNLV